MKIRRITAVMLTVIMLVGTLAMCTGCDKNNNASKDGLTGTELAKLLLSRERLDASQLAGELDFYNASDSLTSSIIIPGKDSTATFLTDSDGKFKLTNTGSTSCGTFSKSGNTYTWSNFSTYCNMKSYFDSYIASIEGQASAGAQMIDQVKKDVGVTDKWIGDGEGAMLLHTESSTDALYERFSDGGYRICKRYMNSSANAIYEMYTQGTGNKERMLCNPGVRYEYAFDSNEGFNNYIVADKSKGYWELFTVYTHAGGGANVQYLTVTSGLSFCAFYDMAPNGSLSTHYTVISGDMEADLLSVGQDAITIFPNGFNGIKALQVVASDSEVGGEGSNAKVIKLNSGGYAPGNGATLVLNNGKQINIGDKVADGKLEYRWSSVSPLVDGYYPDVLFTTARTPMTESETVTYSATDMLKMFKTFMSQNGITCKTNFDTIINGIGNIELTVNRFLSYYTWNGNKVDSIANINKGRAVEANNYTTLSALYDAVKNNPVITWEQSVAVDPSAQLADISELTHGNVSLTGGKIVVDGLKAKISDSKLLEKGTSYRVNVALVSIGTSTNEVVTDSSLTYSDVLALAMEGSAAQACSDSAKPLEISQSAQCSIPTELSNGYYLVAVYVATADGIPISKLKLLQFNGTVDSTVPGGSGEVAVTKNSDNSVKIGYTASLDIEGELAEKKSSYTASEISSMMTDYALKVGTPVSSSVQISKDSGSTWQTIGTDNIATGTWAKISYNVQVGNEVKTGTITIKF